MGLRRLPQTMHQKSQYFSGMELASQTLGDLSPTDVFSSGTIQLFKSDSKLFSDFLSSIDSLLDEGRERLLDMGCGYGGLSRLLALTWGFKQTYGIEIDDGRATVALERGLKVSRCNIEDDSGLPFPSEHFDLVTTFGVLDHLKNIEAPIAEARRVLRTGGHLLVSTTNLSSWVNRIALLLGYQPRNLEISKRELFGVHESYRRLYSCTDTLGRISSFTLRAFEEMLEFYGYRVLKEWGARLIPKPDRDPAGIIGAIDRLFSKRPSLAVRYLVFAKKV